MPATRPRGSEICLASRTGNVVAQRPLEFYDTVARGSVRAAHSEISALSSMRARTSAALVWRPQSGSRGSTGPAVGLRINLPLHARFAHASRGIRELAWDAFRPTATSPMKTSPPITRNCCTLRLLTESRSSPLRSYSAASRATAVLTE
jgi:hypothetical protein